MNFNNAKFPMSELYELNNLINKLILSGELDSLVNPRSQHIVFTSDLISKPALLILAVSLLRFSDAKLVMLINPQLESFRDFSQGKTKRPVIINFTVIPRRVKVLIKTVSEQMELFSYQRIANSIRNYSYNYLRAYPMPFNNKAHLFRHLEGSYLYHQNYSQEIIRKRLGHVDNSMQHHYIHNMFTKEFFIIN